MKPKNITPLYKKHLELKASMVDFAGYKMPMQYSSIFEETKAVRDSAGLFDVSHMGEIEVSGERAVEFVNYLVTFDISKLKRFQAKYTVILNEKGGIIDDLVVYNLADKYLIVVNASNQKKDFEWFLKHKNSQVKVKNAGKKYFQIALQGPLSEKIINSVTEKDVSALSFYHSKEEKIANIQVLISRTGYTGEDGFEIYHPPHLGEKLWDAAMQAGKEFEIEPIGLGARDSLRLEMKYMLYGNDIDQTTNPIEAGLSWIVKLDKGDFIGSDVIRKVKDEKPSRRLVAFELNEKGIPRHGYDICGDNGAMGKVTSGIFSPVLNMGIGLGYVPRKESKAGNVINIDVRGKHIPATIIKPPFYKEFTHK
ncbi:MAG: glycine cleavage system aminomethyltransferase GcvT [candidate division WOR-3 bacterium]